jgi:hypothetical protein
MLYPSQVPPVVSARAVKNLKAHNEGNSEPDLACSPPSLGGAEAATLCGLFAAFRVQGSSRPWTCGRAGL